ncbi:uncharacterized protein TrAtP1_003791 [Trichoderma atroviride]|uniref:uncharacterized protein n=1 Tax=Hypocrea atroviridis TaxID=63577 RepID=UPI003317548B|nr:hypothetical protein TrAtP1_003791 [Trichoderma atroviride]
MPALRKKPSTPSTRGGLGAGDGEIDAVGLSELDEAGEVLGRNRRDVGDLGASRSAAVARDRKDSVDSRRLAQFPSQSVLAATVSDEEDSKAGHCGK